MRSWLYKCNARTANAAGLSGDWSEVFGDGRPNEVRWPGHRGSGAAEVHRALDERMSVGDVVVAQQTDRRVLVGVARVAELVGDCRDVDLILEPIWTFDPAVSLGGLRVGTALADSAAFKGRVTLRELNSEEWAALVEATGAPRRVLRGRGPTKRR